MESEIDVENKIGVESKIDVENKKGEVISTNTDIQELVFGQIHLLIPKKILYPKRKRQTAIFLNVLLSPSGVTVNEVSLTYNAPPTSYSSCDGKKVADPERINTDEFKLKYPEEFKIISEWFSINNIQFLGIEREWIA